MFEKDAPIIRQGLINLAQAFDITLKGVAKMLLTGEITAVADPYRVRFRPQHFAYLDAFDVMLDGLTPHRCVGMRETAELV